MTSSNGNIFRVTGHLCGNSPVPAEFPAQRPVTRSFDLRLNKRLSKQSWGWWFETLLCPLWRHRNVCDHLSKLGLNFIWRSWSQAGEYSHNLHPVTAIKQAIIVRSATRWPQNKRPVFLTGYDSYTEPKPGGCRIIIWVRDMRPNWLILPQMRLASIKYWFRNS